VTTPSRRRRSSARGSTTSSRSSSASSGSSRRTPSQQVEFGKQWQLQKDAVEKLKEQLRTLNDKIEEAKRKKNILIARQKRAEAQKAIQDTMRGLSDNSAFDTFERMSQKVDQIEAESEASVELGGELAGDTLQQKFKKLEAAPGGGSDLALAELKAKMGLGPMPEARPALPSAADGEGAEAPAGSRADKR
jgi:phage shock protein A